MLKTRNEPHIEIIQEGIHQVALRWGWGGAGLRQLVLIRIK